MAAGAEEKYGCVYCTPGPEDRGDDAAETGTGSRGPSMHDQSVYDAAEDAERTTPPACAPSPTSIVLHCGVRRRAVARRRATGPALRRVEASASRADQTLASTTVLCVAAQIMQRYIYVCLISFRF